jgi:cytochrome c553
MRVLRPRSCRETGTLRAEHRLVRITAILVLLASCQSDHQTTPDTPAQSQLGGLTVAIQAAHRHMHDRFGAARQIEYAIARGDLRSATMNAHVIAELDEPGFLPAWQPYIASVRDAARQIELAADLDTAGVRIGTLGLRCAQCHEALGAKLTLPDDPRPSTNPILASQMVDHQWAAMRMWEGLIASSARRWQEGSQALTTIPLDMVAQAVTPSFHGDVDDVARVRMLANRAPGAKTDAARADLFGTMLGTCAHCHSQLRDR